MAGCACAAAGWPGIPLLENLAETVLEAGRWYHVAVAVRITLDSYERVLFYLDGEVDANDNLALPGSAEHAAAISDWHESAGPRWQAHHQRRSRHEDIGEQADAIRAAEDHLYIGLQHDRRSNPFAGTIDELALHRSGLLPGEVQASIAVHRRADGELSSGVIVRPASGWGRFDAEARTPDGTAIDFSVTAPDGTALRSGVSPGDSLADLDSPRAAPGRAPDQLPPRPYPGPALLVAARRGRIDRRAGPGSGTDGDGAVGGEVVEQGEGAVGPLYAQFGDAGGGAEAEVG